MSLDTILHIAIVFGIPLVIAITFHEAAHGFVAYKRGDDTAKRAGRLTFNPIKHIDLFGTVVFPVLLIIVKSPFLFGYAKPVPVNFGRLYKPRLDMVWVAAAGPGMNFLLGFCSALLFHTLPYLPQSWAPLLGEILANSIFINCILGVFNLLPLPPLDGGRVAVGLLPDALAFPLASLERYGILILLGLLIGVPLIANQFGSDFSLFTAFLLPTVQYFYGLILILAGLA